MPVSSSLSWNQKNPSAATGSGLTPGRLSPPRPPSPCAGKGQGSEEVHAEVAAGRIRGLGCHQHHLLPLNTLSPGKRLCSQKLYRTRCRSGAMGQRSVRGRWWVRAASRPGSRAGAPPPCSPPSANGRRAGACTTPRTAAASGQGPPAWRPCAGVCSNHRLAGTVPQDLEGQDRLGTSPLGPQGIDTMLLAWRLREGHVMGLSIRGPWRLAFPAQPDSWRPVRAVCQWSVPLSLSSTSWDAGSRF